MLTKKAEIKLRWLQKRDYSVDYATVRVVFGAIKAGEKLSSPLFGFDSSQQNQKSRKALKTRA
jgi:hypothetical protein